MGKTKVKKTAELKDLSHPLRTQILQTMESDKAGEWSPNQLAELLGAPLGNVSYHVRQLQKAGVIRAKREAPVRGTLEHFYVLAESIKINGGGRLSDVVVTAVVKQATEDQLQAALAERRGAVGDA